MLLRLGTTELENGEADKGSTVKRGRITRWGRRVGVLYRKSENFNKPTGNILVRGQVIISGSTGGSDQLCPVLLSTSIISRPMTPGLHLSYVLHALSLTIQSHSTFSCTSAISIFSHRDKARSTGGMRRCLVFVTVCVVLRLGGIILVCFYHSERHYSACSVARSQCV